MLEHTVFQWITQYGYIALFLALMLGVAGLPIPDETLLTFSGYLVFKGEFHIIPALLCGFFGSICGITLSYILGRSFGLRLIHRYGPYLHITEERLKRAHNWMEHAGRWSLTLGYFVPGVRHLTAYVAGTSEMAAPLFAVYAYTGGLLWSTTFLSLGYFLGDQWSRVSDDIRFYGVAGTVIAAAALLIYFGARKIMRRKSVGA